MSQPPTFFTNHLAANVRVSYWHPMTTSLSRQEAIVVAPGQRARLPSDAETEYTVFAENYERLGKFDLEGYHNGHTVQEDNHCRIRRDAVITPGAVEFVLLPC